jgi:uncharacterized membrane protein YkoI
MRKINFVIALIVFAIAPLFAQKISSDKVPANVLNAFKAKFPAATDVNWGVEKSTDYEAEFKINGEEYSANFNQNGKWLETEMNIDASKLPEPVSQTLAKEFAGFKISEAEKIETPDKGIVYEIEMKDDKGTSKEVEISAEGKVLDMETKKKDND